MFLLDTDVLSELRRSRRDRNVVAWISDVTAADLFLSVVTIGEIELDLAIAATALEHGLIVVTRNVSDFEPTGVPTLNPFNARPHRKK